MSPRLFHLVPSSKPRCFSLAAVVLCLAVLLVETTDPVLAAGPVDGAAQAKRFTSEVQPLVAKYCLGCHSGANAKGDVALDKYRDAAAVGKDRDLWQNVLANVQAQTMPPEGRPRPTGEERQQITDWIEAELNRLSAGAKPDPGRVTIRRLNRAEYNNTIRDLVGVHFRPADDFPADDVGYGFDNIGDVLSLPPILLEKYLAAAEKIASAAIMTRETFRPHVKRFEAEKMNNTLDKNMVDEDQAQCLASTGELFAKYHFPRDGQYLFRIRAYGQQAGDEPAKMAIRVAGEGVHRFDVPATAAKPEVYQTRVKVQGGDKRVAVAFLNDFYEPENPDPNRRDRNLVVDYVEIQGPMNFDQNSLPETHRRIITCQATPKTRVSCSRETIKHFATKAFRRPVTAEEINRLVKLAQLAEQEGDSFERGVQLMVQAVLVSPHFLYRVEIDPEPNNPNASHYLNDYELASRLSYFLWSSMPDEELFARAKEGKLREPEVLEAQVRRMLKDAKAQALVENFGGQWLQTRSLATVAPDPERFPNFDEELRDAMQAETEMFFSHLMREDRSVLDFLDSNYTFLNDRLARHYGIPNVVGKEFRRVDLPGHRRGGVITQASLLTVTSNPTRTSPVKRGKWILENILGTPPPPPPPAVPELSEDQDVVLSGTLRQRMEQHRADPNCASCHQRMDPLGFGLENFDGIGAFRKQDGKFPIDASGAMPNGQSFNGPQELKKLLKGRQDEFALCLAEKMLTYALGRGLAYYDTRATDEIARELAAHEYKFSALVIGIVESAPFQMRRGTRGTHE
jgi:hypothetical protein